MACNTELRNCCINGTFIVAGILYILVAIIVLALGKAQDSSIVYAICIGLIVCGFVFIVIGSVFCCINRNGSRSLTDSDCNCLDENFCSCVDEEKRVYHLPEHNANLIRTDTQPDYYTGGTDEYTISSKSPYQQSDMSRSPQISRPFGQQISRPGQSPEIARSQQPVGRGKPDVLSDRKWQTNEWSPLTKRSQNVAEIPQSNESNWAYSPAFNRPKEYRSKGPSPTYQQSSSPQQSPQQSGRPKYQITGPRGEIPTITERRGKPYVEPLYQSKSAWKPPAPRLSPMEFPTGETSDSDGNISPRIQPVKTYSNPIYNAESPHYAKPAVLPKNWTLARGSTPEKPDLIPIRRDQNISPTHSGYDSGDEPIILRPNPSLKSYLLPASNFSYYSPETPQTYRQLFNPSPSPVPTQMQSGSNLRRVPSQSSLMYTPILGRPVPITPGVDHSDSNYDLNVGTMRSIDMPSNFRREYFY